MDVNMELEFDKYCKIGWSPRTVLPAPHPQTKGDNKYKPKKSSSKDVGFDLRSFEEGFTRGDNKHKSKKSSSKDVGYDFLTLEESFTKGDSKRTSKRSSSKDVGYDLPTLDEEGFTRGDNKHKSKRSSSKDVGYDLLTLEEGCTKGDNNKRMSKRSSSKDVGCDLPSLEEEGFTRGDNKHKSKRSSSKDVGYDLVTLEEGCTKGDNKRTSKRSSSKDVGYDLLSLEEGFTEIKLRNFRSVSCKSLPTREPELEREKFLRRGSVYQASGERRSRRSETSCGRKKIEFSLAGESSFSFSILDSICGSDEEETLVDQESSSAMSLDLRERHTNYGIKPAERDTMENRNLRCDQVSSPCNTGNLLEEKSSLSAKLVLPHSPSHSEGNNSNTSSSKSHFTPIKRMLDPLTKAKTHRSPSDASKPPSTAASPSRRANTPGKSMFHDFSTITQSGVSAQLGGNLKMEQKHGVPYFEFSTSHSEDVFVAKTRKDQNALNPVYTFHYIQGSGRKRSSASSSRSVKYSSKDAPMVGQMQVSCHPQKDDDSMVVEFVVYDVAKARKSEPSKLSSNSSEGTESGDVELDDLFGPVAKPPLPGGNRVDFSSPCPRDPADLHRSLEVATVVMRVPIKETESSVDDDNHHASVKVNVVAPVGTHGLPSSAESQGPSPLLERWRLGGGCECGGWDMGCPLVVFGNRDPRSMEEHLESSEKDQPLKLYVQGGKEKTPALTITVTGNGQYSINFHPLLSTLQAFAVCVAILQTTEASFLVEHKRTEHVVERSSLKGGLVEEGKVNVLSEGVTQFKERRKVIKMAEENLLSFVINPPFSPIARV